MTEIRFERVKELFMNQKTYNKLQYRPAFNMFKDGFKLAHEFIVCSRYDDIHDKTYIWVYDSGYFFISLFSTYDSLKDKVGTLIKLPGNIDVRKFTETNKKFEELIHDLYNEKDREMEIERKIREQEKKEQEEETNIFHTEGLDKLYNEVVGKPLTPAQA